MLKLAKAEKEDAHVSRERKRKQKNEKYVCS